MSTDNNLAGFELCLPDRSNLEAVFTKKQLEYWNKLPAQFRFEDIADQLVPRATLDRLLKRAESVGWVEQNADGTWQKKGNQ